MNPILTPWTKGCIASDPAVRHKAYEAFASAMRDDPDLAAAVNAELARVADESLRARCHISRALYPILTEVKSRTGA